MEIYLFLYSNFSPYSKMLINIIKNSPLQSGNINMNFICVDNNDMKKIMSRSKNIKIKTVPCILILHKDGNIEKFEGKNAFEWTEQVINTMLSQIEPPQNLPPPEPRHVKFQNPQNPPQQSPKNLRNPEPAEIPPSKAQPKKKAAKQNIEIQQLTSIDDLESEEDTVKAEFEEDETFISKPPASIRNGPGNFDSDAEFGEQIEVNRNIKRGIKEVSESTSSKGKKGNIMAIAMEMQKKRETEDSKKDRKHQM
jgi:hypothetical protein